jgi:FkbM family methyltransferase
MEWNLECAMPVGDWQERLSVNSSFVFDQPHYNALNVAREASVRQLIESLRRDLNLGTAIDVGCGLGYFAGLLHEMGFSVVALDGRQENIIEAQRRYPGLDFRLANAENASIQSFGKFDLGFCFGLLYHLENPFVAVRNLFALTRTIAVVEGMVLPGDEPVLGVRDEGPTEDQALRYVALYPTENGLVKLLYRSGFPYVYRFRIRPPHADYETSVDRKQVRTMLVAANVSLPSDLLQLAPEPTTNPEPWRINTWAARLTRSIRNGRSRALRFVRKPRNEKVQSVFFRWVRAFPRIPIPVRLPYGGWWLARNNFLGAAMFYGGFENPERSFVERLLGPGMTVLDIGAHHGYYTLLASRKVGAKGSVLAIEASPRERTQLRLHLRINRCKNVRIESRALGEAKGTAELFLVQDQESGCNSLHRPAASGQLETVAVQIERLDRVLEEQHITRVDFIKLDVEGAELSVLKGATELLSRMPRPVILAEVQDIRTEPWGYPAREIIRFLSDIDYVWFRPLPDGWIEELDTAPTEFDGNFVAIPAEQAASVGQRLTRTNGKRRAAD